MLILFHQVGVSVVRTVLDFARLLGLWDQSLEPLLVKLEQFLVEEDLLGDSAQAQLLCDEDLRLFADRSDKEHEGVAERLAFRTQFAAILRLVPIRRQQELHLTVHKDYKLFMCHAGLQPNHFLALLGYEFLLRAHILVGLLLEENFLQDVEEAEGVELEEVAEEFLIGQEAHNVIDVASPLEGARRARGELLALHEEAHDPEQLVAYVRPTVLNLQLDLPILDILFLSLDLFRIVHVDGCLVKLAVESLSLENACALALHVVGQLNDILPRFYRLVAHHQVKKRAEYAYADGRVIRLFVIEESGQQVDQRGGEILFLADVPHVRGIGVLGQIQVQDGLFKQFYVCLTVKLNQTRQDVVRNNCLLEPS